MSVEASNYLEQLKQQHASFVAQRDNTQAQHQQLVGAIFACELMIKHYEGQVAEAKQGEPENGGINIEAAQQAAEV